METGQGDTLQELLRKTPPFLRDAIAHVLRVAIEVPDDIILHLACELDHRHPRAKRTCNITGELWDKDHPHTCQGRNAFDHAQRIECPDCGANTLA